MALPSILLVDDEKPIRITLQEALGSKDYNVSTAATATEALEHVEKHPPALVLLDLKLPDRAGMDVLRELGRRHPDIPVIVITAYGNVEIAMDAMDLGAYGFVEKPFTAAHIRTVVAHALDRDQQATETAESYDRHLRDATHCLQDYDLKAALEHARQALSLDPTRPEAFNVIGILKQLRGEIQEAQRYYQSALALHPDFLPAQQNQENLARPPHERKMGEYWLD